jgi:L-lactate dehydrogenase
VKVAGHRVREAKGYTDKAIGIVVAYLADVILNDQKTVLPVSTLVRGTYDVDDIAMSMPCVIGGSGIAAKLFPEDLTRAELIGIQKSAAVVRAQVESLDV